MNATAVSKRYPGATVTLIGVWNAVFVVFTTLQLRYNKAAFHVGGLPLISISDVIEFAVPWVVVPFYWVRAIDAVVFCPRSQSRSSCGPSRFARLRGPRCARPSWLMRCRHVRLADRLPQFARHLLPMILGTVLFTHGHGIHLSSNSLSNLYAKLSGMAAAAATDASSPHSPTFAAALDLYDEYLSHML